MVLPLWSDTKIHLDGDGWVCSVRVTPAVGTENTTAAFNPVICPYNTASTPDTWDEHDSDIAKWCSGMTICFCLLLRGFTVSTAGRTHVFKPVSVQAMWWVMNNLWSHSGCLKRNLASWHTTINLPYKILYVPLCCSEAGWGSADSCLPPADMKTHMQRIA